MSNLSAGVQILIDQLKENPDAFFGSMSQTIAEYPKFGHWRSAIEEELVGVDHETVSVRVKRRAPATWFLNEDEKAALADAYLQAKRQRFDAEIIYALNAKPKLQVPSGYCTTQNIVGTPREAMRLGSSGGLSIGTADAAFNIAGSSR